LTLKEKGIYRHTKLIIWEFGKLHLTLTTMGLVSYEDENLKYTRLIVEEDYTKNPKVVVQD